MKPAMFDYVRADSAEQAASLLQRHGEGARILAGGQSLMAVLNMRLAQPALLIDISRSTELAAIVVKPDSVRVGAAVTQAQLQAHPEVPPLLALAFPFISHFQIRNRGTVCGSIAHADPSAELPLCLVALKGTVHLRSARGARQVPAHDFFTGLLSTARRADELIDRSRELSAPGPGRVFRLRRALAPPWRLCAVRGGRRGERPRAARGGGRPG